MKISNVTHLIVTALTKTQWEQEIEKELLEVSNTSMYCML